MTATSPTTTRESPERFRRVAIQFLKELAFVVIGALIVSSLLRAFVGQLFVIPSQSMENTLLIGDRVVVQKLTAYQRGQVVVFKDPGGWLPSTSDDEIGPMGKVLEFVGVPVKGAPGHLIKRLVGMPGDVVICCDDGGRLTVNGQALDESSYLYSDGPGKEVAPSEVDFEVVVPRDHVFVMGDHRDLSADSRCVTFRTSLLREEDNPPLCPSPTSWDRPSPSSHHSTAPNASRYPRHSPQFQPPPRRPQHAGASPLQASAADTDRPT